MSRRPLTNEPPLLDPERALRLVRDACAIRKEDAGDAWDPSDLAFVREAVELALADEDELVLLASIVPLLERVGGPESEALLDELDARASEEAKEWIEDVRTRAG